MTQHYLCIQRSIPQHPAQAKPPTPEQMEAMMAKFHAWKDRYASEIIDMGGKLAGGGVVTAEATLDGPFAETKEIVGGFMIVATDSLEKALQIARESPGVGFPGSSVEVREIQRMA